MSTESMDDENDRPPLSAEERRELEESLRAINARGRRNDGAGDEVPVRLVLRVLGFVLAIAALVFRAMASGAASGPTHVVAAASCPRGHAVASAPRWSALAAVLETPIVCESDETYTMVITTLDESRAYAVIDRLASSAGWVEAEPWHAVSDGLAGPQTQTTLATPGGRVTVAVEPHPGYVVIEALAALDEGEAPRGWFRATLGELDQLCYGYLDPDAGPSARCAPIELGSLTSAAERVRAGDATSWRLDFDLDFRSAPPSVSASLGRPDWLGAYEHE
jgi:hypothetical protein